jgi:hypothetical protein
LASGTRGTAAATAAEGGGGGGEYGSSEEEMGEGCQNEGPAVTDQGEGLLGSEERREAGSSGTEAGGAPTKKPASGDEEGPDVRGP